MNILLANDDGYSSSGLQILCSVLSGLGHNVYVVAPDGQRSGFSHAMHYNQDLTLTKLLSYCGAKEAYICSGSPADCVRIGILHLGVKFDLLIAGPNNAANFGRATLCSGTIGCAEEGTLCGVKSIALSRLEHGGAFFSTVKYLADNLEPLAEAIGKDYFLNINVPNLPTNQIKGVKVCPQSTNLPSFDDAICQTSAETVRIVGKRNPLTEEFSDVALACDGYVTITPMTVARTDNDALAKIRRLEK